MQRRNLFDGRAAGDDRRNPVTYPRDIRMFPIGERFIDRRHALRLHKAEHQLIRTSTDGQDPLRLMRDRDDRALHIRNLITPSLVIGKVNAAREKAYGENRYEKGHELIFAAHTVPSERSSRSPSMER